MKSLGTSVNVHEVERIRIEKQRTVIRSDDCSEFTTQEIIFIGANGDTVTFTAFSRDDNTIKLEML
jgi:hypothetical protein